MIQGIIVTLIFIGAVGYLSWIVYKQLQGKSTCATGCGKCNTLDVDKIEKQILASMTAEKSQY
jgi:hypothetical protein